MILQLREVHYCHESNVFDCVKRSRNSQGHTGMGPLLSVSSGRLKKLKIDLATPGIQCKWLIHLNFVAP